MMNPNVAVFGYDEFLLAALDFFSRSQTRVSTVVFPSNRRDWRANKIREIVREKGFSTLEQPPRQQTSEFAEKLRQMKTDLIFVWSYPMILPAEIIEIPRLGCVNVHLGLLPEYRGVNGIRHALLNGEEKTGVTIHFMDAGIDSGDIIARISFPITAQDDIISLLQKSKAAGLHFLENGWRHVAAGNVRAQPQDESKAKYYSAAMSPPETIDWSKTNVEIHNLIRASVAPFDGVHTFWNGRKLVIRKSAPLHEAHQTETFGTVEKIDSRGIEITTGGGNLLVTEIEIEDKKLSDAKLADLGLKIGNTFQNSESER
jgi:methionyl-tRNA formyltransferase